MPNPPKFSRIVTVRMDDATYDKLNDLKCSYNMSANAYLTFLILSEYDKLHGNPALMAALDQFKSAESHLLEISKALGIPSPCVPPASSEPK